MGEDKFRTNRDLPLRHGVSLSPLNALASDASEPAGGDVREALQKLYDGGVACHDLWFFKELKQIIAALSSSAGPAVEAVPVVWRRRGKFKWFYRESPPTSQTIDGYRPLYAHPAPTTVESLPYQVLFDAIAAATDIASGGLAVSISVEKFRAALAPATEGRKS